MRLRTRLTIVFIFFSLLPLSAAMSVSLWHSTNETFEMEISFARSVLRNKANDLSSFFDQRLKEMRVYANSPIVRSGDFSAMKPFLISEAERQEGIYEKFIFGLPSGHFYNTKVGNPFLGGIASFNDKDPKASPKSIKKRDYWKTTIEENLNGEHIDYFSSPMISYTTGVKQVVVASSIVSDDGKIIGLIGGALPWQSIHRLVNDIRMDLNNELNWNVKFMLTTSSGVYWYHWDRNKIVHLAKTADGNFLLNSIGEKISVKSRITDEKTPEIVDAGNKMSLGNEGYVFYVNQKSGNEEVLMYTPIGTSGYSIAAIIPKANVMEKVVLLKFKLIAIMAFTIFISTILAVLFSNYATKPIIKLMNTANDVSRGKWNTIDNLNIGVEINSLVDAFNSMVRALQKRESEFTIELRNRTARIESIVNNTVDGLITIDDKGKIETYNKACEEIFGYSTEEVIGKNVKVLMPEPYHKEHDGYLKHYHDTGEKKIIGIGREVEGKKKDGTIFPIDLSVSEIDVKGRKLYSGIVRDITERKLAEQALIEANAELEEFAYRTSHDLRSPLVSSISLLGMTEKAVSSDNKELALESLEHVQESLIKLEQLVKDILQLTRTKNEHEDLQSVDVSQVIDDALAKFKHMNNFDRMDIRKKLDYVEALNTKKDRIVLIVENLISNAIKYQAPDKKKPFIEIRTDQNDGNFIFEVEDNGIGIPEDQQENMFQMFKRFHPKISFGSGLGLYMMKKSADILNGEISFKDTGDGSLFRLVVPIDGE